jgi:hydroxyacylglutathione hydrolase
MDETLKIVAISALRDNYIWVIHHTKSNQCVVVDPGESVPVLNYLKAHQTHLSAIIITHYHSDHTGGIGGLLQHFPTITIYGSALEALSYRTKALCEGDQLSLLNNHFLCTVYEVPGHTLGHIAYYVPHINGSPAVFTGDTLFSGGCGGLFEGTPSQLYQSLLRLKRLPDATRVYCGHEYTVNNLRFSRWLEPNNLRVQSTLAVAESRRAKQEPTLPSVLATEWEINPFLRCDEKPFIAAMEHQLGLSEGTAPLALFTHLRALKDNWNDSGRAN